MNYNNVKVFEVSDAPENLQFVIMEIAQSRGCVGDDSYFSYYVGDFDAAEVSDLDRALLSAGANHGEKVIFFLSW